MSQLQGEEKKALEKKMLERMKENRKEEKAKNLLMTPMSLTRATRWWRCGASLASGGTDAWAA